MQYFKGRLYSAFSAALNIVINYKVVSEWNQPIIIVMGNFIVVKGTCMNAVLGGEKIRYKKNKRTTSDKYAIICSEFGCNISKYLVNKINSRTFVGVTNVF